MCCLTLPVEKRQNGVRNYKLMCMQIIFLEIRLVGLIRELLTSNNVNLQILSLILTLPLP